jgi:nitroreductase
MRHADHPIDPHFLSRMSTRAFVPEPLSHDELMRLFEAARWAPSSSNGQPWRFVYAHRDTAAWAPLFDLLVPFNQAWVKDASVLVVVLSETKYKDMPMRNHSFDAGAAWMSLALQAEHQGLVAHAMGGYDVDKARAFLHLGDHIDVDCMVAIGKRGDPQRLPEPLREREVPSTRKPLSELVFEGKLPG